jgi:hypothetical protein
MFNSRRLHHLRFAQLVLKFVYRARLGDEATQFALRNFSASWKIREISRQRSGVISHRRDILPPGSESRRRWHRSATLLLELGFRV